MRFFLLLVIPFLMISCKSQEQKDREKHDATYGRIQNKLKQAELSEAKIDTIVLGFRFGMTEKEFVNHINKLVKQKKVYINNGVYLYDFQTKNTVLKTSFSPKYFKGKLYELTLKFNESKNIAFMHTASMMSEAKDVFDIKAKSEGFIMDMYKNEELDSYFIYYIKDNLIVEFNYLVYATMTYTNASVDKERKEYEESGDKVKSSETYKDL